MECSFQEKYLMRLDKVSFQVGADARRAEVSGQLKEGGFLLLRGSSGSGKTTLLKVLARLTPPLSGQVSLDDRPWTEYAPVVWRRAVHYLAQKPVLFDGTVRENLNKPFELAAVKKEIALDPGRLFEWAERLLLPGEIFGQDARTVSGGEASRVALIRALLVNPRILLLDEPLAALDGKAAAAVLALLTDWVAGEDGRGAVLVSHGGDLDRLPGITEINLEESR